MDNPSNPAKNAQVEHALDLLDQAVTLLDGADLDIAAAKVDDARTSLRLAARAPDSINRSFAAFAIQRRLC